MYKILNKLYKANYCILAQVQADLNPHETMSRSAAAAFTAPCAIELQLASLMAFAETTSGTKLNKAPPDTEPGDIARADPSHDSGNPKTATTTSKAPATGDALVPITIALLCIAIGSLLVAVRRARNLKRCD